MPKFLLVLIKPSHYDDDGYVIRWWRTMIPSNSLAALYGIAADCAERRVLGPDVDVEIDVIKREGPSEALDEPGHREQRCRLTLRTGGVSRIHDRSFQLPSSIDWLAWRAPSPPAIS